MADDAPKLIGGAGWYALMGWDGTNIKLVKTDSSGNLVISGTITASPPAASVNTGFAARTTDLAITAAAGRLVGFSLGEAAGTPAAAKAYLKDGTDATGEIIAVIDLAPSESVRDWFGDRGIEVATGVFLDMVSGTIEGAVYTGAV